MVNRNTFATSALDSIADFRNGKSLSPSRYSLDGKYPVYGSNGQIARTDELLNPSPVVVIGRVGAFCGSVYLVNEPSWVTDNAIVATPKPSVDVGFLYFRLRSLELNRTAVGSAQPLITQGGLKIVTTTVPPPDEQRAIAHILGTLDDKIELNRRMNQTLEAMAQALFKSWFVDFELCRHQGMQDSPLGKIPVGWVVKRLDEVARFVNGLALQRYPPAGEDYLPVIKIAELRRGVTESSGKASPYIDNEYIIEDGDVLFSWSGSLEVCIWCGGRGALNQHLFKVTSAYYPKWFYYFWIKYHLPEFQAIASGKATTMGHIQRYHLSNAFVAIPPQEELDQLDKVITPLVEHMVANNLKSRTIVEIRDVLLPKLLSGEIRVEDAEKFVEVKT